ncbi:MAG: glycosyltransferase [Solirubrobacteraceae bacterium]
MIGRRRRLAARALDRRFDALAAEQSARLDRLAAQLEQLTQAVQATQASVEALSPLLRTLASDDPGHRRRLHTLRAEPGYTAAWEEPDPLVTISIPTRRRPRLLVERSLASALAQTHERLEVLVIGDAAGPEIAAAVEGVGDPRVRYVNLTHQFVREDGEHWLTAATLTRNEAYRSARGHWLVDLDDDDALRPGAVAALLAHARAERLEVAYGVLEEHHPGGATKRLGGFPPAHGEFGWQGAVVHAGLRFFERELVASDLGWSGDWFRAQRMLRAGVRIGHLEQVTCDYYPSFLWGPGD